MGKRPFADYSCLLLCGGGDAAAEGHEPAMSTRVELERDRDHDRGPGPGDRVYNARRDDGRIYLCISDDISDGPLNARAAGFPQRHDESLAARPNNMVGGKYLHKRFFFFFTSSLVPLVRIVATLR